ncbi:hypothetical protein [Pseudophaeobacter leonis]|uniref:hypothetical protein n=1 Tax=Pseudophaeobacter leonis TaxID=1144477 RepID=UPI00111C7177|nr:hypothetical protein [Pseudophaeobacter leonis]
MFRVFLFAAAVSSISALVNAQSADPEMSKLLSATRALEERIQKLENILIAGIPRNAVVAFDQPNCPAGWDPYHHADGRFILGLGDDNSLGATGGSETHRLTIEEMPTHDHGAVFGGDGGKAGMLNEWSYHASGYERMRPAGGGRAHDNMPPFIVLIYCKKS